MTNFTVGQKLFYVGAMSRTGKYVIISKVARKWLEIQGQAFRVEINTLDAVDKQKGFCGACYLSEYHYLDIQAKKDIAKQLRDDFSNLAKDERRLDKIDVAELERIKQWLYGVK
ncbi:beta barrel domain-containing protein [Methylocucumis oryzae]|uniref:Uncharacterized protein n=1 Tax=Methylocucumis oryzae TaxID=1632867 RepID=A0A0F3IN52_9GAMM|nr:hypothetical protein [Methylocucumis oryzae]KJV07988.1 hypothetical protein VZ94_00785 [Methylocucumis oryzae]